MCVKKTITRLAGVLVAVCLLAGPEISAQDNDEGYALWMQYQCYICHDHQGYRKASATTNPLAGTPLPFEAFAALTRYPSNQMPPFSEDQLSDEELRAMWEYVRSQPPSPEAGDIPVLREWLEALE